MDIDNFNFVSDSRPNKRKYTPTHILNDLNLSILQCLLLLFTIIFLIIFMILFLINFNQLRIEQNKLFSSISSVIQTNSFQNDLLINNGYYSKDKCVGYNQTLLYNIYSDFCKGNLTNLFPNPSLPIYNALSIIRFDDNVENLILNGSVTLEAICLPTLTEVIFFLYSTVFINNSNIINYLPNLCLFPNNENVTQNPGVFFPTPPIQYLIDNFFTENSSSFDLLKLNEKYDAQSIQAKIARNLLKYRQNSIVQCFLTEVYCIYELGGPVNVYYASLI